MAGAADSNRDTMVTASELIGYLVTELSASGQIPVAAGDFSGSMVLAAGVTPPPEAPESEPETVSTGPEKPEYTGPRRDIRSAKFIWSEGSGQRVTCENSTPVSCEPSCYARRFPAGACMIEAVIDGVPMSGWVIIDEEGAYRCGTRGPELACKGT